MDFPRVPYSARALIKRQATPIQIIRVDLYIFHTPSDADSALSGTIRDGAVVTVIFHFEPVLMALYLALQPLTTPRMETLKLGNNLFYYPLN